MVGDVALAQVLAAFGAGLLASLSPCVYPLIPITVGFLGVNSQQKGRLRLLFFLVGQVLTFVVLGLVAVKAGEIIGFSSESRPVRVAVGLVLLVSGIFSMAGRLPGFTRPWNRATGKFLHGKGPGITAAFFLGAGSSLVASPCSSPILAGVLAMMASTATLAKGAFFMSLYSLGFSFVFILIGLGMARLSSLPRAGRWMDALNRAGAVILIGGGLYFIFGGWVVY